MILYSPIALLAANTVQEVVLKNLIGINGALVFHDVPQSILDSVLADVKLLVHSEVGETASSQDIERGLERSPNVISADGSVSLLKGANDVANELAKALSLLLCDDEDLSLMVPHAYAVQEEIESLEGRQKVPMCFIAGTAFYQFNARCCNLELIRSSLGSTISMYSVAWVFRNDGERMPVAAFVPIFDGDGWAIAGSVALIFPGLLTQVH